MMITAEYFISEYNKLEQYIIKELRRRVTVFCKEHKVAFSSCNNFWWLFFKENDKLMTVSENALRFNGQCPDLWKAIHPIIELDEAVANVTRLDYSLGYVGRVDPLGLLKS